MEGAWFSRLADELARCLTDAGACANACELLLESLREAADPDLRHRVVSALAPPAAIGRVLAELVDEPPSIVLAACRLCRESARIAVAELEALDDQVESAAALAALRTAATSCDALIEAAR